MADSLNGDDWRLLMRARWGAGDWQGTRLAAERAYQLGSTQDQGEPALFAAAAFVKLRLSDSAFAWLTHALVDQRFPYRGSLEQDTDFAPLTSDPRWAELVLPPAAASDRVAGWRGDLAWLLSEIGRLNAPVREQPVPDTIRVLAARLSADIPQLSDPAVTVRLMQLVAAMGRGHNGLWPWIAPRHGALNQAPLSFFVFAGGDVRIVRASPPFDRLVGYRVKVVGRLPVLNALTAAGSVVERENDADLLWRGPEYLASPAVLYAVGASDQPDSLRLVLEGRHGDSVVVLPAGPFARRHPLGPCPTAAAPPPMALRNADQNYWLDWLPADSVLFIAFNSVINAKGETLQAFGQRVARELEARPATAVVIDLRRNNGGNTYLYQSLLRALIAWDARGRGTLYALIGRNTYSAAENFIVDLDRLTDVVFVGEPSGAKPATNGDESPIVLPWSGLQGGLSAVYWALSGPRDDRLWIAPALLVPPTAEDWLANRDAAMDAVLQRVRSRR